MDNVDTQNQQEVDTSDQQTQEPVSFNWKEKLPEDLRNSPTMQKYGDDVDGLVGATKGLLSLNQMLGHEKVPVPKDLNDQDAWGMFNKALGVPDSPDAYEIDNVEFPEEIKDVSVDQKIFKDIAHKLHLRPDQAKALWSEYSNNTLSAYKKAKEQYINQVEGIRSELMKDWGDAYQSKVELGQQVINKFAGDEDTANWLTSSFLKDPRGAKFLAQIGENFAEHQIGEFSYQRQSLTPAEAKAELDAIYADPKHPYNDPKATQAEHDAAVERVNALLAVGVKGK